ncbi:MAG: penicillin-binding protein 2 [Verrucomicrobia bacterium]|jgi:cell division protein FtsI/penicillin-binding protein 2|nr:penicillin-binding protein 2 [Verrucomicrobiota bacterium]
MAKRLQYRRLLFLAVLLGAAFAGLGYRLVDLQVLRHEELRLKAAQNTQREIFREPRRGDVLDAKGNLLATSVFVKTVCADPVLVGNRQADVAHVLAPLLQMSESDLGQRLLPRRRQNGTGETATNRYVVLKRKVPVETWEKIQAGMSRLSFGVNEKGLRPSQRLFFRDLRAKAVFADPVDDQQRVYPNQSLAAHVLGFVGMDEREVGGTHVLETSGKEGIEFSLNSKLSGVRGWRVTEKDRRGRELVALRDQDVEPRDGLNVVLTLDSVVQHLVESALAEAMERHTPLSISGIVVRPRTGEILALATLPDFDPNTPGSATPDMRRNRVIADVMEPGSTFKIVVVSGALNDRAVTLADAFDCEHGHFAYAGRVLHDHESYGVLSVQNIITKSSNIGAAKIGIRLGQNRLYDYIREYGFGDRTGIQLPGEVGGILHPTKEWTKVSIAQIPMGHGVAVTRLQMMMAMCAIANRGVLMRPLLMDRFEDREGRVVQKFYPQAVRQILSEPAAKLMVAALKTVVSPDGTAPKAALEHYSVAGKTGTAQKAGAGGYLPGKYVSSFMGFFPAENPELCISIVMDEPKQGYYGGQIAAPVFKQIAERAANYLNIRPDLIDNEPDASNSIATAPDRRPVKSVSARTLTNP